MTQTVEMVLPLGTPVTVAPGVTVTLKKVTTPKTGAYTALLAVRHGNAAPSNTLEKKFDELTKLVLEKAANSLVTTTVPSGADILIHSAVAPMVDDMRNIRIELQPLLALMPNLTTGMDEAVEAVADAVMKRIGKLEDMDDRLTQIQEGVRLLLDE